MGKAKVITKAIKKLAGKKDKKMRYSSTKAEKENAIEELKRNYGRNYKPTDRQIINEVKLQRMLNAENPVRAAKDLIKERRKKDKLDSSQKKVAKEMAKEEQQSRDAMFGFYERGGDVVQPKDPLTLGAAKKLAKGLREKKDKTARQRFLTGFASGVFKLTPADRYMRRQHPSAPREKGPGGAVKKSKVMRKGM